MTRRWCLLGLFSLALPSCSSTSSLEADGGGSPDAAPEMSTADATAVDSDQGAPDGRSDLGPAPPAPWPTWTLQHWVWEDDSTQQSALELVEAYLQRDIPVGALVIDSPWETGYNTFEWDPARFVDPAAMIDALHQQDVRVLLWIVPAINTDVTALYDEAAASGYFMQKDAESGPMVIDWWKGDGSLIDYFNPAAVAWWHGLVDRALALPIDGWKCDGLDIEARLASYSPGAGAKVSRGDYSAAYYRDFFDYTRAKLGDDRLIMSRPADSYGLPGGGELIAFTPREITFAGWVGDQDATFDGLQKALLNMVHSAALGYVIIGSDIGGYREEDAFPNGRSKELFIRWAQLGALSPLMENGGGGDHRPWAYDEQTVEIYRRFVKLHLALIPYLDEQGSRAFAAGEPLVSFVDHESVIDTTYSFLLGPDIFVAPIIEPGNEREVTFPPGRWIYLFDRASVYAGGEKKRLTIALEEYPVFLREGSTIADANLLSD